MTTAFLILSIIGFVLVLNAFAPRRSPLLLGPSFFAAWLTIELAPWWLFWHVVGVSAFVATGAVEGTAGAVAVVLSTLTAIGLIIHILRARRTTIQVGQAIADLDLTDATPAFPRGLVFFPVAMRHRKGVNTERNIVFAERGKKQLKLDVVKADTAKPGDLRPGILQIHGGGWVIGDKREQAIPLLNHLAANGWVGVNANYRLSPKATFPEHLIDVKEAIAWYRRHASEYGADPDFLCVTGGSAGGHLCALVALTPNVAEYQPGFEDVDTTVRAAVPIYGVYDFTNRHGRWHKNTLKRFIEPMVMKKKLVDDPEAFAKASPLDLTGPQAPPMYVVHGSLDTLAPVEDARDLVAQLREQSNAPVLYAEMQGAQHAFEIFPSFRAARVIESIERFLFTVHREYLKGRTGSAVRTSEVVEPLVDN